MSMGNLLQFPTPDEPADEPDVLDQAAIEDEIAAIGPRYQGWLYKKKIDKLTGAVSKTLSPPAQPDKSAFETWAHADQSLFTLRTWRYLVDLQFYRQKDAGIFDLFRDGDETIVSPEPTAQINKLCAMLAGIDVKIRHHFRSQEEQHTAYCLESWERYTLQQWEQNHRAACNGSLRWEIAFSMALYGVAVARVLPDPEDAANPTKIDLLDPSTCFWVPGDKWGLLRMSRIYQEPLGKIIDAYDANGDKGLHAKFTKHFGKDKPADTMLDYDREVSVTEVWTRWHRYVSVDSIVILNKAHEYGQVPFRVYLLPGEMGMNSTPETSTSFANLTRQDVLDGLGANINTRQWDLACKGQSFFHSMRHQIRYEEKLLGLLMTQVKLDTWPPQVTTSPYPDDPDAVDLRPKGHTRRRPGEQTVPVQTNVRGQVVGPLISRLQQFQQKSGLPDNVFGMVDGSNITGFAESSLIAQAKDRMMPYIEGTQVFLADVLELANYLFHGFGHLYVDDPNGELRVPGGRRNPTNPMAMLQAQFQPPMPPMDMGPQLPPGTPPGSVVVPPGQAIPPEVLGTGGGGGAGGTGMSPAAPPPPMGGVAGMGGAPGLPGAIPGLPPPAPGYGDEPDPPEVEIDRDKLAMLGFRPEVELLSYSWQEMTQIANVAGMMIDKGLWSKWTGREKAGVEDPGLEQKIIDWEQQQQMAALPPGPMPGGGTPPGLQSVQGDSQPALSPSGVPGLPRTGRGV